MPKTPTNPKAVWFKGTVLHKTKATTNEVVDYIKSKGMNYRIRELKKGYKVDVKI